MVAFGSYHGGLEKESGERAVEKGGEGVGMPVQTQGESDGLNH